MSWHTKKPNISDQAQRTGEVGLATRIKGLKARRAGLKSWIESCWMPLDEAESLLELADRYLSGWRPDAE